MKEITITIGDLLMCYYKNFVFTGHFELPHWDRVTHLCISQLLSHHWFRKWLFGTKSLSERMLAYCYLGPWKVFQLNLNQNMPIFIQENELKNVVFKMVVILSCLQWVNTLRPRQNCRHFPMHFLEWKCILTFHWILFLKVRLAILQHWFR